MNEEKIKFHGIFWDPFAKRNCVFFYLFISYPILYHTFTFSTTIEQ